MASIIKSDNGVSSGITGIVQSADSSGQLVLQTTTSSGTATTAVTIDNSQNVGIGTTSPATTLHLNGATSGAAKLRVGRSTSDTNFIQLQMNGGDSVIQANGVTGTSGSLAFWRDSNTGSPVESARFDSSGNLLVGTTSTAFSEKFNATQSANQKAGLFFNTNASFTNNVLNLRASRNTTNSSYGFLQCSIDGVADKLFIYDSGNVVNANNSYGSISDIKLKENIVDATPKLEDLCKVKVRQYNLKSDPNHKQIGVVAQELEEVFAGLVETITDKDIDGNDLGTTTKQVKYSVFVPMLIKAIQELSAQVTSLQATVETQATTIATLQNKIGA